MESTDSDSRISDTS